MKNLQVQKSLLTTHLIIRFSTRQEKRGRKIIDKDLGQMSGNQDTNFSWTRRCSLSEHQKKNFTKNIALAKKNLKKCLVQIFESLESSKQLSCQSEKGNLKSSTIFVEGIIYLSGGPKARNGHQLTLMKSSFFVHCSIILILIHTMNRSIFNMDKVAITITSGPRCWHQREQSRFQRNYQKILGNNSPH